MATGSSENQCELPAANSAAALSPLPPDRTGFDPIIPVNWPWWRIKLPNKVWKINGYFYEKLRFYFATGVYTSESNCRSI